MGVNFTLQEGAALYGLLAETTTDIIIRTDDEGFIMHASPAIGRLGVQPAGMLIAPHVLDLVHPAWIPGVKREYEAAMQETRSSGWFELMAGAGEDGGHWYAMKIRCLNDEQGADRGAMVVLRDIEERKLLEADVFSASFSDPLTGLTNRRAFNYMLRHLVDESASGCLALFDIDHFRSLNLKFGLARGDDLLIAFSRFLRNSLREGDIVSRVGGDRFGVLLPDITPRRAGMLAEHIVETFADLAWMPQSREFRLTASCGITSIAGSFDATMTRADKALHLAKAQGGSSAATNSD